MQAIPRHPAFMRHESHDVLVPLGESEIRVGDKDTGSIGALCEIIPGLLPPINALERMPVKGFVTRWKARRMRAPGSVQQMLEISVRENIRR